VAENFGTSASKRIRRYATTEITEIREATRESRKTRSLASIPSKKMRLVARHLTGPVTPLIGDLRDLCDLCGSLPCSRAGPADFHRLRGFGRAALVPRTESADTPFIQVRYGEFLSGTQEPRMI
jgi:hypothetical protein